ncbi:MAG: hypothetical protein ACPG8F_00955 [Flavobacteriaceae bacterium]
MKHLLLFSCLCSLFYSHNSYGQEQTQTTTNNATNESHAIERQGKLFFSVGTEYRIGPSFKYSQNGSSKWTSRGVNETDINQGSAFSIDFDYFIFNDFSIGFGHSIRYDHIHQGDQDDIIGGRDSRAVIADTYGLLMDYHFNAKYYFRLFNESFFVHAGVSFLNNGPRISKNGVSINDASGSRTDDLSLDTRDIVNRYGIGYQNKRFNLMGGVYHSTENPFYSNSSYIVPYIQLNYRLNKLFKN